MTERRPPDKLMQSRRRQITPQASKFCTDASEDVHLMGTSMKNLWDSLDEAAEVVSCPKINGLYRSAVWDQLCAELPGWLIALLVSCMVLIALLVSCMVLSTLLLLLVSRHLPWWWVLMLLSMVVLALAARLSVVL